MPRLSHGESRNRKRSSEFTAWHGMKQRCYNTRNPKYNSYGGRGIRVCGRWFNSLENFIADMGRRPSSAYSLDRKDVNGDYTPANCRWARRAIQAVNKRNYKGVTVQIDEDIRAEVAALAESWGKSLTEIVNEYLRMGLQSDRLTRGAVRKVA